MNASDTYAALMREDYLDWATRFRPIEDELLTQAYNPELRLAEQNQAAYQFDQGFESSQGETQRRLDRMGVTLTAGQKQARDLNENMQSSLGRVDAFNRAGRRVDERNLSLVSGSTGGARTQIGA